jgi:hypothetical protein
LNSDKSTILRRLRAMPPPMRGALDKKALNRYARALAIDDQLLQKHLSAAVEPDD